jgi:hypothetical protein
VPTPERAIEDQSRTFDRLTLGLTFFGLVALVHTPRKTAVVFIDAEASSPHSWMPYHVPTFQADRGQIHPMSARPDAAYFVERAAWNINRTVVTIRPFGGHIDSGDDVYFENDEPDNPKHPDGKDTWARGWWIADLRRAVPGATLREDWQTCPCVQARVDLRGGQIVSLEPDNSGHAHSVWKFGDDSVPQALTTEYKYVLKAEHARGFEIHLGGPTQGDRVVVLTPDPMRGNPQAEAHISARFFHLPMSEQMNLRRGSREHRNIHHVTAFFDLLESPPKERPIVRFVEPWPKGHHADDGGLRGETTGCVPAVIRGD